ncbi:MAG TPA: hypothetical protein VM577_09995 [Anaerovoracaceae bacterium]|nr:hypothetical protein [Anaerovoracaceae bacterium]
MSRGGFKITRSDYYETDPGDKIDWLDRFAQDFEKKESKQEPKSAVEVARLRNYQSIADQISAIVGGNPRHSSVETAVQDYQERTGLKEYLKRQSSPQDSAKKTANVQAFQNLDPRVRDNIINFIKNRIETHRGLVPLPAIQEEILSTFRNEGLQPQDVNNDEVAKLISQAIIDERQKNPESDMNNVNLGRGVGVKDMDDDDGSNSDFFRGLLPVNQN